MTDPVRLMIWHWGRRGGGPRYTLELARALARRDDLEVHLSLSRQSEFFTETAALGLPGWHVDTYDSLPQFVLRTARVPWIRRGFGRYLADHRIEVVQCTMDHLWSAFVVPEIRRRNALYLLTVHDAERHPGEDQSVRRWLLARDIAHADGALTLTDAVAQRLKARFAFPPDRVWTAPHGTFDLAPAPAAPRRLPTDRPPRLMFFGRILPYKGLDLLLRALPLVRRQVPDVQLEIWGNGDLSAYRADLEGLPDVRVENRWLEEAEIPGILDRCDVCVLPYREASQSGVVASAVSLGLPCVATPVGGLTEQVLDGVNGLVAADVSPAALAEALVRMLSNAQGYQAMSDGALRLARTELSWDRIGDTVSRAIHALRDLSTRQRGSS